MSYEQALSLAGHAPTWELRAAVIDARFAPNRTRAHDMQFALAAQVVLKLRARGEAVGDNSYPQLT